MGADPDVPNSRRHAQRAAVVLAAISFAGCWIAVLMTFGYLARAGQWQSITALFLLLPIGVSSLALLGTARGWRAYVIWSFSGALSAFTILGAFSIGRLFVIPAVLLLFAGVVYLFASDNWWDAVLLLPAFPLGASTLSGTILVAGAFAARLRGARVSGGEDLERLVLRVFVVSLAMFVAVYLLQRSRIHRPARSSGSTY